MVSWENCQTFIRKLNSLTGRSFRLPTEAEWEYAARGGNKSKGYKYSGSNDIDDVAWYYHGSTHDVATMSANELGIYDMSGNVWEWVQDRAGSWKGPKKYDSVLQVNPQGPSSGSHRVFRGGSWHSSAGSCRVSIRYNDTPSSRFNYLGLRLVF
jgi:formylglycine-generating enzyme required for sulfatase activity